MPGTYFLSNTKSSKLISIQFSIVVIQINLAVIRCFYITHPCKNDDDATFRHWGKFWRLLSSNATLYPRIKSRHFYWKVSLEITWKITTSKRSLKRNYSLYWKSSFLLIPHFQHLEKNSIRDSRKFAKWLCRDCFLLCVLRWVVCNYTSVCVLSAFCTLHRYYLDVYKCNVYGIGEYVTGVLFFICVI